MVLHLKMHNHVIKQNSDMLSDATGCPTSSRKVYRVGFQHAESKFAIRFALCPLTPGIQAFRDRTAIA